MLPFVDALAILIFLDCLSQWHCVADMGVLLKTSLSYDAVKDAAARHGYELCDFLHSRVRILERWYLDFEKEKRANQPPPLSRFEEPANRLPN